MLVIETFSNKIIIITIIYDSFLAVDWKTRSKFWMASEKNEKANWRLMTLERTHLNLAGKMGFVIKKILSTDSALFQRTINPIKYKISRLFSYFKCSIRKSISNPKNLLTWKKKIYWEPFQASSQAVTSAKCTFLHIIDVLTVSSACWIAREASGMGFSSKNLFYKKRSKWKRGFE